MINKRPSTNLRNNQSGMAAFAITFILIIVISMIALSFARIIRREQQQALDRNLSSRAFYAAESGINLAANKLRTVPAAATYYAASPKTNCNPDSPGTGYFTAADYSLEGASSTQVDCLTIKTAVPQLTYQNVSQNSSQLVPLNAQAGTFNRLEFYWQNSAGVTNYGGCTAGGSSLPTLPSWGCNAPLLRVDIVNVSGALSRSTMITGTLTVFFNPVSAAAAGNIVYGAGTTGANQGRIISAHCATGVSPYDCMGTIQIPGGWSNAYARVMPYYVDASVAVKATNGVAPVNLTGAQAIIDATGRAQDIVRRMQAVVPIAQNTFAPNFAILGAAGICKRYAVVPGTSVDVVDPSGATASATFDPDDPCS